MAKVGDTVRYLNSTGGGRITRIDGRMAYVDEDGFETPVLLNEIVVVMSADADTGKGARLMFDQKAYDAGRAMQPAVEASPMKTDVRSAAVRPEPETPHGDRLNIALAFEPSDLRRLDQATFNAVLVNDSNYCLDFSFLRRADGERGWSLEYRSTVMPNELIDLATYSHADLGRIERVALQATAYKEGKEFGIKPAFSVSRRLDLTKFHKLHSFRPGVYFDNPVIEIRLVRDDMAEGEPLQSFSVENSGNEASLRRLAEKYRKGGKDGEKEKKRIDSPVKAAKSDPASNPRKLLPPIEVDLHIGELTDSFGGLRPADMLEMQLGAVRKTMAANNRRIGQKIIFIHGKGEGVLRNAVIRLLKKEYPKAEIQDASFQEYGFGATLVTVH